MPSFRSLYRTLRRTIADTGKWWPGESDFEIVVGAILTQNTNWPLVERALDNLRAENLLDPQKLLDVDAGHLGDLIRPAGYFRQKTQYIKAVSQWFIDTHVHADMLDDDALRASLLSVRGVGEETADDIVLYVYHRPAFIYDTYARRLLSVAGFGDYASYTKARKALDAQLRAEKFSVAELAEFHGLIVEAGKQANRAGGWDRLWPAFDRLPATAESAIDS